MLQNHTSQTQVEQVFAALNPAIATHLSVNEYSIVHFMSAIRSTYPVGPLAIAQDLNVWDISPTNITQRRYAMHSCTTKYLRAPFCVSHEAAHVTLCMS